MLVCLREHGSRGSISGLCSTENEAAGIGMQSSDKSQAPTLGWLHSLHQGQAPGAYVCVCPHMLTLLHMPAHSHTHITHMHMMYRIHMHLHTHLLTQCIH